MAFSLYLLVCADGSYYAGHTDDLPNRLDPHYQGTVPGYTQRRRPVRLVLVEEYATRMEALARERQIKGWSRAKKTALVKQDWPRIIELARSGGSTGSPRTE